MSETDLKMQLERLVNAVAEGNAQIKSIVDVIKGNPMNPDDRGIVGRLAKVEETNRHQDKRIYSLESMKDKGLYLIIGLSVGTGASITQLINYLLKK